MIELKWKIEYRKNFLEAKWTEIHTASYKTKKITISFDEFKKGKGDRKLFLDLPFLILVTANDKKDMDFSSMIKKTITEKYNHISFHSSDSLTGVIFGFEKIHDGLEFIENMKEFLEEWLN